MPWRVSWVCFDCRIVIRQAGEITLAPDCQECGNRCTCVGSKVAIPPKQSIKGWQKLRAACRDQLHQAMDASQRRKVRRIHEIERELTILESRADNCDRTILKIKLKEELDSIQTSSRR